MGIFALQGGEDVKSFITLVGYQTNLMVYGSGGYAFTDLLRVDDPLQLLPAVAATAGIAVIWGV
ncbi:hypothetical protein [Halorubrum laminariae]|uniref:Uncharacterized protein n=1 Tax=Halorubrum laminariae TaxID=1433523 RepID=A0ABD6C6K5_9EURY|nr:hypothetical protein [Halorubrum laminariae]